MLEQTVLTQVLAVVGDDDDKCLVEQIAISQPLDEPRGGGVEVDQRRIVYAAYRLEVGLGERVPPFHGRHLME